MIEKSDPMAGRFFNPYKVVINSYVNLGILSGLFY